MKKTTAIAFALGLTMLLSGTACAETSADAAVFVEPVRTGESEYLDWIDSGWNWLSGKLESGYEYLTGPVAEEAGRTIAAWRKTVEDYLMNSQWPEEVRSAWNTLREAAEEIDPQAAQEEQIRALLAKRRYPGEAADPAEKQKTMAFLYRKGYPIDLIRHVLDTYLLSD